MEWLGVDLWEWVGIGALAFIPIFFLSGWLMGALSNTQSRVVRISGIGLVFAIWLPFLACALIIGAMLFFPPFFDLFS